MDKFLILFLLIGNLMGWSLAIFLANEMRKKFMYMDDFRKNAGNFAGEFYLEYITTNYGRIQRAGGRPGMNTLVFTSDRPFTTLVGFHLVVPDWARPIAHALFGRDNGFDYYGRVISTPCYGGHVAYVTTWFGRMNCLFQFIHSAPNVKVELLATPTSRPAHCNHGVYPPHFYQKWLGWYA